MRQHYRIGSSEPWMIELLVSCALAKLCVVGHRLSRLQGAQRAQNRNGHCFRARWGRKKPRIGHPNAAVNTLLHQVPSS